MMTNTDKNPAHTRAKGFAVVLTLSACRGRKAPETAGALNLDPLVYAALREELGVTRLPRAIREAFDAAVAADLAAHNKIRIEQFEMAELPGLGWIQITDVGEENMYFEHNDGHRGFVKIG